MMPVDEVADVGERACLGPVAEDRDRPVLQRLTQERRNRPTVMRTHPRPVRIEDPHDRRIHTLLTVIRHRQRLGIPLRLVIHPARPDRVHMPPIGLRLRMHLRIAVDLLRRGRQEPRAMQLRQPQRVMRPVRPDLQRMQRQPQIVDRRRRRREVKDEIDRFVDEEGLGDVLVDEQELRPSEML